MYMQHNISACTPAVTCLIEHALSYGILSSTVEYFHNEISQLPWKEYRKSIYSAGYFLYTEWAKNKIQLK